MTRPANPSYTIPVHAPDVNYPAGVNPWSGTPTKQTHPGSASVGFTPNTGIPAQVVNRLVYDAYATDTNAKNAISGVLDYAGQICALNYTTSVSPGGVLRGALWNPVERKWYAYGDAAIIRGSQTNGWSWDGASVIAGVAAGENVMDGDADLTGNMVFSCMGNKDRFTYNASTFTWTKRTDIGGGGAAAFATYPSCVRYDPVRLLWCWIQYDAPLGTPTPRVYTSSDRTTWTSRTPPSNLSAPSQYSFKLGVNKTTGRLVWVDQNRCATSDDGGVSWTARANINVSGTTNAELGCLAHKPGTNEWLYVTGEVTGTPTCTVNRSTDDGATWTPVASLSNNMICDIAYVGQLVIGTARTGSEVVYSLDDGATWQRTGFAVSATTRGAYPGDGCAMLIGSGTAYPPFRTGRPAGNLT